MRKSGLLFIAVALVLASACKNSPQKSSTASEEPEKSEAAETKQPAAEAATDDVPSDCEPPDVSGTTAESIADHAFNRPVYLTQPPGEDEDLYILEKDGRVLVVADGKVRDEPFMDIRDRVGTGHNERGLLGLAFHPDYQENGRFFIYYTPEDQHKNVAAEWKIEDGEPREVRRLVEPTDPEGNHNGGMITFGPDGYLWVGMGDGGGAGDRHGEIGNGLNKETLFGSILRLDVDAPDRDFAADGNPFIGKDGADQIWAYGLRNPWRFSFDRETGELFIGDVGQNEVEEISYAPADAKPPLNYGWRAYEGNTVYDDDLTDRVRNHVAPIVTFQHGAQEGPLRDGCSVTGGYVYRGNAAPGLQGAYLYGDFCSQDVVAFRYCDGEVIGHKRIPGLRGQGSGLGSFGEDNAGNVYLLYHNSGEVMRVVAK
ncbi:MAG: PQQ-dependent sugar dehydrogenase [Myxococcota bacterium]